MIPPSLSLQAVQAVISNLLISHIELRSEESPDIQAHSHQRSVEKVVVPLGEALSAHQARYLQVGTSILTKLLLFFKAFNFSYKLLGICLISSALLQNV